MTGPISGGQFAAGIHKEKILLHLIRMCPCGGEVGRSKDRCQHKGTLPHAEILPTRIQQTKISRSEMLGATILRESIPGAATSGQTIRATISLLAVMHRGKGFPTLPAVDIMSSAAAIQTGSIHPYQFALIRELRRATSPASSANIGGPGAGSKPWKVW